MWINSSTGWTWDTSEGILISEYLTRARSRVSVLQFPPEVSPNLLRLCTVQGGQFDVHGVVGGMAYGAAFGAPSPEVWYQPGPEHEQLNPAWFPHVQLDGMHHHGGTGVYLPRMDHGAGAQTQGARRRQW